jgi:UDP-glucose:(glucosyl)LPS alpha-1,2-glucosyltransferase
MGIVWDDGSVNSTGGTELMSRQLEQHLPADLLDRVQIHISRFTPVEPGKKHILWCHIHDFPELADGGWRRFDRIVFVSHWQAQRLIEAYGISPSRCVVIANAIDPVDVGTGARRFDPIPADQPIRIVYTSVPGRGLDILAVVFEQICRRREDVELDVYSSYDLYGWGQRDELYRPIFDVLNGTPRVRSHGVVPNDEIRRALSNAHIFAYPSTVLETCCLCLLKAMSAGLACIHPNTAALPETAAGHTLMYGWEENATAHAYMLYFALQVTIAALRDGDEKLRSTLRSQKEFADSRYAWNISVARWTALIRKLCA